MSKRKLVYLQGGQKEILNNKLTYLIQPGDVLSIRVFSLDPNISNYFNIEPANNTAQANPGSLYLRGYSVSDSGYIQIPMIGKVKVINLDIDHIQSNIQILIDEHFSNATVVVKLISFKISVIGEVNAPGYYYIYNNSATIFEAIGMAGDIATYGNRKNIKIIRQENNKTIVKTIDLTDDRIVSGDYYFLMPNDVVYVEPLGAKLTRSNITVLSVVFSGISTFVLLFNFLSRR
ncbi:MAG: polysaccharide biosynthesis/export family protein [Cytophagaceae bacterium]